MQKKILVAWKSVTMFEYVHDYEAVKNTYKMPHNNKPNMSLKLLGHLFSIVSYLSENAILICLILDSDSGVYRGARIIKDATALGKNLCEAFVEILFV